MNARERLGPTATTLYGASVGLGCSKCNFRPDCGGIYGAFDCLHNCCQNPQDCKIACPNSHRFGRMLHDAGGFYPAIGRLTQRLDSTLPLYVPVIHHRYCRSGPLDEPIVGLPTSRVVALRRHYPNLTASRLREFFRIRHDAHIVLVSVSQDKELEKIWRDMLTDDIPGFISRLGIEHITSPNFSVPDDLPRTEGLVNIARILKASENFSRAGLSVIPHLNATHERQWRNWAAFLKDHDHLRVVAKEFQTGLSSLRIATWHISRLLELQQRIGRGLHLCAIGGRRHMALMMRLDGLTIIDSSPFFQTIHRQLLTFPNGRWALEPMPKGQLLDGRLAENIGAYRKGITEKSIVLRKKLPPKPNVQIVADFRPSAPAENGVSESQGMLWPDLWLKDIA